MGNKLGKAHITQQSDYLAGGHVNYKTGALQQQAKEAGCLGRLFQDLGQSELTPESVFEKDKIGDYPLLLNVLGKDDYEELRQSLKELYTKESLKQVVEEKSGEGMVHQELTVHLRDDFDKVVAAWNKKIQGKGTQLVAHGIVAVVNAKESAFAVVFYEKSVFDQLPADKSAAKSNGGKGKGKERG